MGALEEVADSVLLAVATIPEGRVTSYGSIGRLVGRGPRLVARVLATRGDEVCWWRVVRADGSIAPQLVAEATVLLGREGVPVRAGRVDLRRHGIDLADG
ncbi:MAG: MGMT family protein [Propionicimonas sp.]|nr:MGMT family protein [Propionicimonas sp.]